VLFRKSQQGDWLSPIIWQFRSQAMALQYRTERPQPIHPTTSRCQLQASVEEEYELSDHSADQDGEAWSSDSGLDAPLPHSNAARHRSSSRLSRRAEPDRESLSMQQQPEQRNTSRLNKPKQKTHCRRPTPNPGGQVYVCPSQAMPRDLPPKARDQSESYVLICMFKFESSGI
jgi:hypothetical protein